MSEVALESLLFRLKGTLSLSNRQWLAAHLVEPTKESVLPYTIEELQSRAEQGVQQIEKGHFMTAEECSQHRQQLMQQYSL